MNKIIEVKKEEKKDLIKCEFCKEYYIDIDIFSYNHKICSKCLFRKIFISNIKDICTLKENI